MKFSVTQEPSGHMTIALHSFSKSNKVFFHIGLSSSAYEEGAFNI